MRILAFIQDAHSIKDIMKAQGIPDFQAPPPIPKFIETVEAIDETPSYDSIEPSPMTSKLRFLGDGIAGV